MIPPLEDEIDEEEEELTGNGMAPTEDNKSQSHAVKGIPPVEEDSVPPEEASAAVEEEEPEPAEMGKDTVEDETDQNVAPLAVGAAHAENVNQDATAPEQESKNSPACLSETNTEAATGSPKEENPALPLDKPADPPESSEKESLADTATEEEG